MRYSLVVLVISLLLVGMLFAIANRKLTTPAYVKQEDVHTVREVDQFTTMSDEEIVDMLEEKAFRYFLDNYNHASGLILDRASNFEEIEKDYTVASIAAVGFALTAFPIGEIRSWISREEAYERTLKTLKFFRDEMYNNRGFYYHFIDVRTGERVWNSEVSSIDTALFLAGALFAGAYYAGTEVAEIAEELYRRVDFQWMLTDGGTRPNAQTLNMGWTPERGFLPYRWNSYSELMILYLLAIGSPTHPIPPETWDAWTRPKYTYKGHTAISGDLPLFVHQYSHLWVDFRGLRDRYVDYFENSVQATLINRVFAHDHQGHFKTFQEFWGLSASDGPNGYQAYAPVLWRTDGTVCLSAALASIIFTPEIVLTDLRRWLSSEHLPRIWGRYGFVDAFNLDRSWWDTDAIGITQGALLLALENYRSGMIWRYFKGIPYIQEAMRAVGFYKH
jgi:hypothetical protein